MARRPRIPPSPVGSASLTWGGLKEPANLLGGTVPVLCTAGSGNQDREVPFRPHRAKARPQCADPPQCFSGSITRSSCARTTPHLLPWGADSGALPQMQALHGNLPLCTNSAEPTSADVLTRRSYARGY